MSGSESLYRCNPRQIRDFVKEILYAGLVPFVKGSPGVGKSSIFGSVAEELALWMIDHRLSTSDPTDLNGLPNFVNGMARFAPFQELFPLENTPLPDGKQGWMIFLDEFNSAKKDVQAASYKVILDRMIGQHKLHPNVVLCLAGNLDTDRALTNTISTALQSRVVHLELEVDFDIWMQDVALKRNYDPRIIAFLSQYNSLLMDFRPDHNEKTFCCPRTWDFLNSIIKDKPVTEDRAPLYAGTISSGVAVQFIQFTKIYQNLITVPEILRDPDNALVPGDTSLRWATITAMLEKVDEKNFSKLATYANRYPLDFRILFFRAVLIQHPELRQHPAFGTAMRELARYLND